jgi:MFS family permease
MKKLTINSIVVKYLTFTGLFAFAISFFFATYVPFLAEKGMNLLQINIINAFFMGFIIFSEMPTGSFADRFGRHRSLALSCFLLSASFVVYYFSQSFLLFILAEVIGAIGQTFASGAAEAWLVDSLKSRNEGHLKEKVFRQELTAKSIGVISGCLLGSFLGGIDLSLPWLGSALFMFLTGIFSLFFKENYAQEFSENRQKSCLVSQIREAWHFGMKNNELLYIMSFGAIMAFSVQALNMQWSLMFKDNYGFSSLQLGFVFIGISLTSAVGGKFSKNINKYIKNDQIAIVLPQLITAAAIIMCARSNTLFLFTGTFMLHEFGRGIFSPLKQTYMNNRIPSDKRATLLSLESMLVKVGALIGLIISGLLAQNVSIRWTWLFSGLFLVAGVVFFIWPKRNKMESY